MVEKVLAEARKAKADGASRYCMGAAWRSPKDRDMDTLVDMVAGVKALGLETCMTLGMLTPQQAGTLAGAGLDYYNHNIDTSEEFYPQVITTRTFADRLETLGQCPRCRHEGSAPAAFSAWAKPRMIASRCWSRLLTCRSRPKACRSIC